MPLWPQANYPYLAMRRRLTIAAIIGALPFLFTACAPPDASPSALPLGMRTALVPPVSADAYVHVWPPGDATFSSEALGVDEMTLKSADVLLAQGSNGIAGRFVTSTRGDAGPPRDVAGRWSDAGPTSLRFGPYSSWGEQVRDTWNRESSRTFAEQFPGAWRDLQSMPENPPAKPIAAGFVRNFGQLLEHLIGKAGVSVPDLASGLSLVRINRIAFVAYADEFSELPEHVGPSVLRDLNVSILAVADSPYPSAVVGWVFDGFVSSLGLSRISVAGVSAHQRQLTDDIYVVVLRDNTKLFFAMASSRTKAAALITAVITTRNAR